MFTSIVRRYQAWTRYETVRRELSHLTDSELADVGITRSDIERIASAEARIVQATPGVALAASSLQRPLVSARVRCRIVGLRLHEKGRLALRGDAGGLEVPTRAEGGPGALVETRVAKGRPERYSGWSRGWNSPECFPESKGWSASCGGKSLLPEK
jgi:uncharacterized protein YjiS (DUF1127 family)